MNNTPNLDSMEIDDLMEFAASLKEGDPGADGLVEYVFIKCAAISHRQNSAQTALMYEDVADMIYDRLPEEVQW